MTDSVSSNSHGAVAAQPESEEAQTVKGAQASTGTRTARRVLVIGGALLVSYAVFGATTTPGLKLGGVLLFLIAMIVGHDGVFMPLVIAAGALIRRAGRLVRAASIISVAVTVVALPFVLGYGRSSDNPSILPLSYGFGLGLVLVLIWSVTLALVLVQRFRSIRQNTVRSQKVPQRASDG